MAIADESILFGVLPRFVAEDLSRVPFINADAMSLVGMLRKMELFEQRMACVEQSVDELKTSESSKSSSSSLTVEVISTDNGVCVSDDVSVDDKDVCLNCPQVNGDQPWLVATYRKNRGKDGSSSTGGNAPSVVTKQIRVLDSKPVKQKLIGTKQSNGDSSKTSLKSGVHIISKTVVHIDNLWN